jgi:hypothetical protein
MPVPACASRCASRRRACSAAICRRRAGTRLTAVAARVEIILDVLDVGDLPSERLGVAHFKFRIDRAAQIHHAIDGLYMQRGGRTQFWMLAEQRRHIRVDLRIAGAIFRGNTAQPERPAAKMSTSAAAESILGLCIEDPCQRPDTMILARVPAFADKSNADDRCPRLARIRSPCGWTH